MADKRRLSVERGVLRSQITKLYNDSSVTLTDPQKISQTLMKIQNIQSKLSELNTQYLDIIFKEDDGAQNFEAEYEECQKYEDKILAIIASLPSASQQPNNITHNPIAVTRLKPPKAPLPLYNDEMGGLSLTKFFVEFENIINKFNYSDYEKFILLRPQLGGKALILLNNISIGDQSYEKAKSMLISAIASPDLQKFGTIKRLTTLGTAKYTDNFALISEMRFLQDEVESQNIDISSVLQYCYLKAMPTQLSDIIIQMTNTNFPSLDQINKNIFRAIERLNEQNLTVREKPFRKIYSETNATLLSTPQTGPTEFKRTPICSLCKYTKKPHEHPVFRCLEYPTSSDKLKIINENKGCIKCGYFNHDNKNCQFRFRQNCKNCNQPHFSFLCLNDSRNPNTQ